MISESVARRYVKALFGAAGDEASALAPALQQLQDLFLEHADLRAVLTNPRLPDARKRAVLLRLVGDDPSPLLQRFLDLLLAKRRLGVLAHVGRLFSGLMDEAAGVRHARVTTAFPLPEHQQQRLAEVLSRQLDCQVLLETEVDPEVIGGVSVQVGDLLIDGTIRRRLEELRARVMGART